MLAGNERGASFNPRSLTGATIRLRIKTATCRLFQSTLPHGSDIPALCAFITSGGFQSTLPHGSDLRPAYETTKTAGFQSTLPHGSDRHKYQKAIHVGCFNPRSLTGATRPTRLTWHPRRVSIHAPSRERLRITYLEVEDGRFQSTLPHGSDLCSLAFTTIFSRFNPRSLTGATLSV